MTSALFLPRRRSLRCPVDFARLRARARSATRAHVLGQRAGPSRRGIPPMRTFSPPLAAAAATRVLAPGPARRATRQVHRGGDVCVAAVGTTTPSHHVCVHPRLAHGCGTADDWFRRVVPAVIRTPATPSRLGIRDPTPRRCAPRRILGRSCSGVRLPPRSSNSEFRMSHSFAASSQSSRRVHGIADRHAVRSMSLILSVRASH